MQLNKILLSLLCVPALLSGAAALEASVQPKKQSVKSLEERALEVFISEAAKRQQLPAMTAQLIETGIYNSKPEEVLSVTYVAWLNANPKAIITGLETIAQVCEEMGIDTTIFDAKDHERVVNIGKYIVPDGPIKELKERPGTMAYFFNNNSKTFIFNLGDSKCCLSGKNFRFCDVWNIPNAYSSITYLDLHGNQITAIASGTFARLSALQELHLSRNKIAAIASRAFAGLSSLQKLDLADNLIAAIDSGAFTDLSDLRLLFINSNKITYIAPGTFADFQHLEKLYINYNDALQLTNPNDLQSIKGERPEWFAVQAADEKLLN